MRTSSTLCLALCDRQPARFVRLSTCQVALVDGGKVPEWVELVPKGPEINALDGRKFRCSDPQAVVDAFSREPYDIPVDYEHASEIKGPKGEPAPACGWISALEVRDGAIWGKVSWTEGGAASLSSKEYRYISPAFLHDKQREIKSIISAGLTNRPALVLTALARAEGDEVVADLALTQSSKKSSENVNAEPTQKSKAHISPQEDTVDPKLLALLGFAADATVDQVLTAVTSLQSATAAQKAAAEKLSADLATARAAQPSLDKYVPRADYDAALARTKTLEDEKTASAKKAHDDAAAAEVDAAMKAGKVTPSTKDFYLATCSTAEGLNKFRDFVKGAPVIGEPSRLDNQPLPTGEPPAASDDALAIAMRCGVTKDKFLATLKG